MIKYNPTSHDLVAEILLKDMTKMGQLQLSPWRIRALSNWIKKVKEVYHINPKFVHVDKDMAEIHAVKDVWDPKVQLRWWHLRKAVREQLKNMKLSTTPYKPTQANAEFPFIDITFAPLGKADAKTE